MQPEKTQTWADNWNEVIRSVLFPDARLKELMLIPDSDKEDIMRFITEYLIQYTSTDEVIEDHKVRVVYDHEEGNDTFNPYVVQQKLVFDIYVKSDVLHTASNDRLKDRAILIFERLKYLLTRAEYTCNIKFQAHRDFGLGAKTLGYRRYRCVFRYHKTY